ncbi:hypothetical protein B0H16DRAFT_1890700 [Mycena metata]|uniref:Uncharacterized protein n=1 Tax=Mycena metata TaxID=1033252 RepID=A0AAD7IFW5_9AGAR|nr:hypothetical protein B0H16DRAFT_1890700 [Mycena metata]
MHNNTSLRVSANETPRRVKTKDALPSLREKLKKNTSSFVHPKGEKELDARGPHDTPRAGRAQRNNVPLSLPPLVMDSPRISRHQRAQVRSQYEDKAKATPPIRSRNAYCSSRPHQARALDNAMSSPAHRHRAHDAHKAAVHAVSAYISGGFTRIPPRALNHPQTVPTPVPVFPSPSSSPNAPERQNQHPHPVTRRDQRDRLRFLLPKCKNDDELESPPKKCHNHRPTPRKKIYNLTLTTAALCLLQQPVEAPLGVVRGRAAEVELGGRTSPKAVDEDVPSIANVQDLPDIDAHKAHNNTSAPRLYLESNAKGVRTPDDGARGG